MTAFVFAVHHHQPDGNFGHVFEAAYADCYAPFLQCLAEFPDIAVSLHHTGPLLEWIEKNAPDYFIRLRALVERGQVELLGGGFYEPMLAVLRERDAIGQIVMMADYLQAHFGVRPTGMWLAERVWEPALASIIKRAGMQFTLLDDGHFRAAGLPQPLRDYYVTDKAGDAIGVYPINHQLRKLIPFSLPHEAMAALRALVGEQAGALVYGDDGEKFGVWPGTKQWVWNEGWLRGFFSLLTAAKHEIPTVTAGQYFAAHPPRGRVYLPTASYDEMGAWALTPTLQKSHESLVARVQQQGLTEELGPFLRTGIWQNFFAKYSESNWMHKRAIDVSDRLAAAQLSPSDFIDTRRELYRAQCNCVYWHGLFGGLYLNSLRDTVFRHLLNAEATLDANDKRTGHRVDVRDVDADLREEVVVRSDALAAFVKPQAGGGIVELDYLPKRFNVTNVLSRRPEAYHKSGVAYDVYDRATFLDHFVAEDLTLADLRAGRGVEFGDFVSREYAVADRGANGTEAFVILTANGTAYGHALTIEKRIGITDARLTCAYRISSASTLTIHFAPELNLTLLAGAAEDRYYRVAGTNPGKVAAQLQSEGVSNAGELLEMVNDWDQFSLAIRSSPATPLWRYPIETTSQSEEGSERLYQGSCITALYRRIALSPAQPFVARITLDFQTFVKVPA